jgi:hypothetical protein
MKLYLLLLLAFLLNEYIFAFNQDTIKFENIAGLIKIPVRMNSKVHYFMFDTGAERTMIRDDITAELDRTKSSRKKITDSNHTVTTQSVYVVQSLEIGNSDLNNQSIITFPDSPLFNCLGVEGVKN